MPYHDAIPHKYIACLKHVLIHTAKVDLVNCKLTTSGDDIVAGSHIGRE